MARRLAATLVLVGLWLATVGAVAGPPRPGTEGNGLTAEEAATLWSRDADTGYIDNAAYRAAYGENRSAIQQVANATDLTFTRPPATAATWTRHDFADYRAGNATTSVYPPHAARENGTVLRDVHATVFAVTPATVAHRTPTETRRYVAPNGTVRGVVDYRVVVPATNASGNRTVSYTLLGHRVEAVRLVADGRTLATRSDTAAGGVRLPYRLDGNPDAVRLVANVSVTLRRTVRTETIREVRLPNGTTVNRTVTERRSSRQTERVVASDRLSVTPYRLDPTVLTARYPDGDRGVAAYAGRPWQGIRLERDGGRVRGVWRFYTARDPRWDGLVHATATNRTRRASPALPVGVHAYPSRLGPRAKPVGTGPELLTVWGRERPSPAAALPDTVHVEVVEAPYTASSGLALRTGDQLTREAVTVNGLVRGVNASAAPTGPTRQLRRSRLSVTRLPAPDGQARFRLRLTEAATGAPISLRTGADAPFEQVAARKSGYLAVAGQRLRTNASGFATVTVDEPGVYPVRYEPAAWVRTAPAYTPTAVTLRYHPLSALAGWLDLLTTALVWALPFAFVWYLGRRLGSLLAPPRL
jgi:hypothetical protein